MGSSTTPLPRAALRYAACCVLHVLAPEEAEGALALCGACCGSPLLCPPLVEAQPLWWLRWRSCPANAPAASTSSRCPALSCSSLCQLSMTSCLTAISLRLQFYTKATTRIIK